MKRNCKLVHMVRVTGVQGTLRLLAAAGFVWIAAAGRAQQQTEPSLLEQSQRALARQDLSHALELASRAVEQNPEDVSARLFRASIYDALRRHDEAIADYDAILLAVPNSANVNHLRGRSRFKAGDVQGSIADFDRAIELEEELSRRLWERGISLYYANEFAAGARQFEEYQQYDASDVENVVWRYLCQARSEGVEAARRAILPLDREDPRVPMMEIYALYRGQATPEDVLAAARAGDPQDEALRHHLFYAHLYVGLYFESDGNAERAKHHLRLADEQQISHYMWDVAHVHLALRGW